MFKNYGVGAKGQIISEQKFGVLNCPKRQRNHFIISNDI